ncbi:MAG: hypothetical protein ABUL42_01105 [Terricaulis silvestris]
MLGRFLVISAIALASAGLAGCQSHDEQSVAQAAQEACAAQHLQTQAEIAECVDQMTANIEAARELGSQPPDKPEHGGGGGGGGHGGGGGGGGPH